ncbi:MAG: UDP-N-acetylmuramoyl-tripeptide--D-alanyl-D-alanine ligase [Microbacteriaceae bacterium]
MLPMTLAEIATAVTGKLILGHSAAVADTVIEGISETDSREITAGGIFFAKPGEVTDGHLFVPAATRNGAALVIVDHELEVSVPQIIVADTVAALGALATEVVRRVRGLGRLRVVGITGSNGKTTTKNLLAAILGRVGQTVAARESFNNEVGAPLTMLRVSPDTDFLVAEMGASRIGEIARLIRMVRPDIGVVLKVGLAHAGEFGGIEAIVTAKSEMVTELQPADIAVLNQDDPRVAGMAAVTAARVIWFGTRASADVRATEIVVSATGTAFTLTLPDGQSRPVRFRVLGEHHVMNALAAAACATALGAGADDIVRGLESVQTAERWRMQVMGGSGEVTIINDAYNASPDSMAAALKTLAQIAGPDNRTVAVLGEMSELGEISGEEHDRIALLAVRLNIGRLVVVGPAARRMHISTINEGSWNGESVYVDTPDAAYELLSGTLQPGDLVLVKSSNSANLRFLGDRLGELFS